MKPEKHQRYIPTLSEKIPLHLIYIPWDKEGKVKEDKNDFDKTFLNKVEKDPEIKVYMWTYDNLRDFSESKEAGLWDYLWLKVSRPTQIVDFYRWFVVYYLGGIYWQYDSENKVPFRFFTSNKKDIVLLTEKILPSWRCKNSYKIRNSEPEEPLRVANQVFWAKPYNPFIKLVLEESLKRLEKYKVEEDYDILYIGANAMVSEVYDRYIDKDSIDLLCENDMRQMVNFSSRGSWRKDKNFLGI